MTKWKKFKDESPQESLIFVTNYSDVWMADRLPKEWEQYGKRSPDFAWSEIELPEVPEKSKEWHRCATIFIICKESEDGLFLEHCLFDKSETYTKVNFCPFCGYSINKSL